MSFELTASMMCANYGHLAREVTELENAGIDSFHIDIMDGRFVANFAMSLNDLSYIAKTTNKPLDVHLMVEHPNNTVELFIRNLRKGDTIYIHPEAEYHPSALATYRFFVPHKADTSDRHPPDLPTLQALYLQS